MGDDNNIWMHVPEVREDSEWFSALQRDVLAADDPTKVTDTYRGNGLA